MTTPYFNFKISAEAAQDLLQLLSGIPQKVVRKTSMQYNDDLTKVTFKIEYEYVVKGQVVPGSVTLPATITHE